MHFLSMKIVLIVFLVILIILVLISPFYIIPWIFGAPYDPTRKKELETIINFVERYNPKKIAELGSGNGKIVIALAKKGYFVEGYEINPFLVWMSKRKIRKLCLEKNAEVHLKNFWKADFSEYDLIVLFQFRTIMKKLKNKIKKECKNGTKIISNTWKFPNMKETSKNGKIRVYKLSKNSFSAK